nr:uncharacterized protein LOC100182136 [Ciona intestinalis]XP_018671745.1 uncharacterized protein LOC100182136 [Ciona intestinalis]XP_026696476.1 uncharacterized protein LOC100182136 [Ciona intestinalis]|eukprot:XP_009857401.1 uncharacterized protein LOC100182136 [Ciona intestinalis]
MPTDSEYGDDIRLLDDLTRLKLRLIDKKLHHNHHHSARHYRRRAHSPDYSPTPPLLPERRRDIFNRKIDKRNELLQKLWEELGPHQRNYRHARSLPPLSPRPMTRLEVVAPWMEDQAWNKTGNTKKDLMELMLIQNAQMQQWLMTQTLQKSQAAVDGETGTHHHYYNGAGGRQLPPIKRSDAGNQYPQDFFSEETNASNVRDVGTGGRSRENSPQKGKNRRKNKRSR